MRYYTAAILFLCTAFVWAAPNAVDFNINVHLSATRMVRERNSLAHYQKLSVIIEGKKCELESIDKPNALLMLDDYKARVAKTQHWGGHEYDSWRVYELLLPDNKTRQFLLVGQSD